MKTRLPWALIMLSLALAGCGPKEEQMESKGKQEEIVIIPEPLSGKGLDRHFRKWGRTYFSRKVDWRWFKAQGTAESNLCPRAVSPAGARGVMQLMPATSKEMSVRLKVLDRPFDPGLSIMMGIAYDRLLWDEWIAPRPDLERLRLTFASYNAGLGNILKAQGLTKGACDPGLWSCVAFYLDRVTGKKAEETISYVSRIETLFRKLGVECK